MAPDPFFVRRAAHGAERRWDRLRFAAKRAAGLLGTPVLLPYRGYVRADGLWLRGRVIEDQGVISAAHTESTLGNIWLTFKRYETDEVRNAKVAWACLGRSGEVTTDEEGYFQIVVDHSDSPARFPWARVELELQVAPGYKLQPLSAEGEIRVVAPAARFGVISDIDDTIIETGAFAFLKHWRTVVANSAEGRTAFPGVSPFYRALAKGAAGPETNPVFYVSSSPWNLYDLFERFLVLHRIPLGPMLLRDFGLDPDKWFTGGHSGHKTAMVSAIMDAFPDLPFLLIGDSGQQDAVIYARIAAQRPGRVLGVHIRDVMDGRHDPQVDKAMDMLRKAGVPVSLEPTLTMAASNARDAGFITDEDFAEVKAAVAAGGERASSSC